ncbi:AAA family ATPase [Plasticicumulans acidivorans]|uniref:ATPase family protein associated with various cellular activities (AAA) n=1 Tax=Plasticicumulans acidivorans TaxID=886464 RepID=A0A317N0J5_9GAMM|nr:ATP-binding protein [Plasticicumulans acidivorans]PWV65793.1 ATPase family protein associated with various cellular activities (AAA) [Plasticicumulans acidivorans]
MSAADSEHGHATLSAWVRAGLAHFAADCFTQPPPAIAALGALTEDWPRRRRQDLAVLANTDAALGRLARAFAAQPAELFLLALTGEVEADFLVDLALAELQAPERAARPALHLACALSASLFPSAALTPLALAESALVRSGLLRIGGDGPLPLRWLHCEPRLWAALCGATAPWPGTQRLQAADTELPAATRARIDTLAAALAEDALDALVLRGAPFSGRGRLAAALAQRLGRPALLIDAETWADDGALAAACQWCEWLPVLRPRLGPGEQFVAPPRAEYAGPLLLLLGEAGAVAGAQVLEETLAAPSADERRAQWAAAGVAAPPAALLAGPAIGGLLRRAARLQGDDISARLLAARRQLAAPQLRQLAQPVAPVAANALVLPAAIAAELDEFVIRCEQRERAWRDLGPSACAGAGPGVRALFAGESGTGKTLAAAVVATRLGAPLYRVDLGALMNKYIGETEKNLAALLDHAAGTDVMLLFDEADALFGRRGEGGDSGERYANMLTNYLLTRIEAHPGIVVLTCNHRGRIDSAFTRRLDAIVDFPLPGPAERLALWQAHLGARAPAEAELRHLATYADLAGGHIRNAVIAAAAQCPQGPLPLALLARMLGREYRKLGRALPPALLALS